jgi:hypothetical protein
VNALALAKNSDMLPSSELEPVQEKPLTAASSPAGVKLVAEDDRGWGSPPP